VDFTPKTAIGSLSHYISKPHHDFQPMNVNYGIIEPLDFSHKKKDRKMLIAKRAFEIINQKVSEEL
ncbi:MAG TPA: methylenetetrahydrofolate--tRNA-(uracil(54)-C(5))-methyltransferase (FADH(2)-oxidizing) TrmFO, partial [Bacilli bacterium]|nr:methylenetetrahydrofolate--tRNA-(uracil(54)-C(5))-methyltransferase (FADH(2)-oxidizing) TrmFO [Bacilli bacterium]